mmetsp:Transcript_9270/g.22804  ORF Transcript_9270/g.22804 Transcript_9270/m.22804 type:complete len:90 (+) Transcript_9270:112-381(+)
MAAEVTQESIEEFVVAARYGDMEDVQSYLSQGVSPDAVDVEGRTALFFASANGHLEVVDVLLEKEAVSGATSTWPTPCTLLDWRDVLSI